ncbi:helix-turn-helix transcriptional regulator [Ruegeria arenilitoris]|uniref:helix-turn-helix transcriptional regulator n=1 Tax=Ruegeria arenilitoris TaxID=1173585 RepID=UPI0014810A20|nr:helix-turn-helix transcriptional regulator [Ruegeria arenilitoris]
MKVVAALCQASQGNVPLLNALRETALMIGADAVSISRVDLACGKGSAKVLSYDANPQHDHSGSFDFCVAPIVCGKNMSRAKPGSAWFGTLDDFAEHEHFFELYKNRRLSESVSILLERRNGDADFWELHFSRPISTALENILALIGPILSDCWKKRSLGRFSEAKLSSARRKSVKKYVKDILSMDNPCRLSRAEYRVCLLLARGLNNDALLSELSISISTLRTHLRNIYGKTGTSSQPELIHDLLTPVVKPQVSKLGGSHVA